MYDPRIYKDGVQGVLLVQWTLCCETPLALRNGQRRKYEDKKRKKKERGQNLSMNWSRPQGEYEVSDLYYGYRIKNGHVEAIHFVPGSSVRGVLRGWTIRHLVAAAAIKGLTLPNPDDEDEVEAYLSTLSQALEMEANAGRLRVEVEPFAGTNFRGIDSAGMPMRVTGGPDNVQRHMTVRGPLD
ncbi:hypothetical protein D6833_04200, partial [Candidatus Parcubacteria bacterium]